jgi:hypothetical protein
MVSAYEVWTSLIGFTLLYGVLAVIAGKLFVKYAARGRRNPRKVPLGRRRGTPPRTVVLDRCDGHHESRDPVWFVLIAVLWVGYFVLEGFDFGVGMLLKHARPRRERKAGR